MHKQNLIMENKIKCKELDIFLLTGMGIFDNIKRKKVRVNDKFINIYFVN